MQVAVMQSTVGADSSQHCGAVPSQRSSTDPLKRTAGPQPAGLRLLPLFACQSYQSQHLVTAGGSLLPAQSGHTHTHSRSNS